MKLPWQKSDDSSPESPDTPAKQPGAGAEQPAVDQAADQPAADQPEQRLPRGYTPPKGRPTPKRREVEIERGIIRDPSGIPRNSAQAASKRKQLKKSMTKGEWKEYRQKEREETRSRQREAQAAMDRGEEKYLMPRDKGPERRFVRDWVDSRRFINKAVMPVALILLVIMLLGTWLPTLANIMSLGAMALMVVFFIEGVWLGRSVNKAVRAKFPGTAATGFGLGFYAYSRVTQPRKWRSPRARLNIGDQP